MMYCFQLIKGFSINPGINLTKEAWALWRYGSRQTTAFTSFFTALSTHFRKLGRRWPVRPRMWIGLSSAMKDRQTSLPSSLRNILVNDIFYSLYCKVKALRWKPRTDSRRTNLLKGKILDTFWEFSFYGQKKFADYEYHSLFAEKVHFHT